MKTKPFKTFAGLSRRYRIALLIGALRSFKPHSRG